MNKRQYCESRESIAYYSGLNGIEIKSTAAQAAILYPLTQYKRLYAMKQGRKGVANCFCNITVKPYKGRKYNPAFVWVCVG